MILHIIYFTNNRYKNLHPVSLYNDASKAIILFPVQVAAIIKYEHSVQRQYRYHY